MAEQQVLIDEKGQLPKTYKELIELADIALDEITSPTGPLDEIRDVVKRSIFNPEITPDFYFILNKLETAKTFISLLEKDLRAAEKLRIAEREKG